MEEGKWQVWLVDANADRVGNPMTFPHSFAGAMAFCRGYMSRANDLATGLVPVPFPCVGSKSLPDVIVQVAKIEAAVSALRLACIAGKPWKWSLLVAWVSWVICFFLTDRYSLTFYHA